MIDVDAIGARLYGGGDAQSAAPVPTPPKAEGAIAGTIAEALYKPAPEPEGRDLPPAVADLRDTPERRLFDIGKGSTVIAEGALDLPDYPVDRAEAIRVTSDLGATTEDLGQLATLVAQHRDVDPDQFAAWHAESTAMVGKEITADDLELARRFCARDPAVFGYLHRSGLGSHPEVVRKFVQLARSARGRGEPF